jgi:hypothetical protein
VLVVVAAITVLSSGCRRASSADCADVPTTADGCRERCHDRGGELAFFREDPARYACGAICECTP